VGQVTYVGLDVHKKSITAAVGTVRTKPRILKVRNTPKGWDHLAEKLKGTEIQAVYEASSCGFEVYDEMTARGWRVEVVAPSHLAKSVKGWKTKTDARDAEDLWGRLVAAQEVGAPLPRVWIPPVELREDRELVRRRLALGDRVSQVKTSILSLLQIQKIRRPEELKTKWSKTHVAWLKAWCGPESRLAAPVKEALGSQLRELDFLLEEQGRLQDQVEAMAAEPRYEAQVKELTKVPGVAGLTALTFLTELGDVRRFGNRRQVASYLGLSPSSYESGEATDRKGHITHMGPGRIRKVLNQAAWCGVRIRPEVRAHFAQLAKRRGAKKALVAEMRRLGIELWHRAMAVA